MHRSITTSPQRSRPRRAAAVRPMVQRLLDAMTVPAFVRNPRYDLVATNRLGYAFYAPLYPDPAHPDLAQPVNFVRFCNLNPAAHDFYPRTGTPLPLWGVPGVADTVVGCRDPSGRATWRHADTSLTSTKSTR